MRTATIVLLLSFGVAATGAAQDQSSDAPSGLFKEPSVMRQSIDLASRWMTAETGAPPKDGFYPELGNMITGAGWISAGPGYRRQLFNRQVLVDGSAAISSRAYKMA